MSTTLQIIENQNVDLEELESFITFLGTGFSLFRSSFSLLKSAPSASVISKATAEKLRNEFKRAISGKNKVFLRARLPIYLVSVLTFANKQGQGVSQTVNLNTFRAMLDTLNSRDVEFVEEVKMCVDALDRPFYTRTLNAKLDPLSGFFEGQTPNAFSNMLNEAVQLLTSKLQALQPQTPPSIEPQPSPTTEGNSTPPARTLTRLPSKPKPTLELQPKPKSPPPLEKDEVEEDIIIPSEKNIEPLILGVERSTFIWGITGVVATVLAYRIWRA